MPFCTQCGKQVPGTAAFCAHCGSAQEGVRKPSAPNFFDNITPRTASMLCYIPLVGWIPCVAFLTVDRFQKEKDVRFHAFQGLYLFVAWLIVDWGVANFFPGPNWVFRYSLEDILKAIVFVCWIFMIIKTSHNENFRLPVVGDLAEKSVAEQQQ